MSKLVLLLELFAFFLACHHQAAEANLLQLCEQIDYFKRFEWSAGCLEFADYGCFCGPGGWGKPADDVDACCMVHDHCYDAAMQKFRYCYPYVSYYHHKGGACHDKDSSCDRFVCECDRALARCLVFKKYHPKFISYRYLGHCKTNGTKYIL